MTKDSLSDGLKKNFNVLDLFSGIGGFSLGLEAAGAFQTVAFCEREPFCRAVLRKHWPDTPIHDDVRTIDTDRLGRVDLVVGGFPCQPFSVAGKRRGAEDDRDLWPVMAALIEDIRPRWVIGENVRGFVNDRMGLQRSLSDLESIGYSAVPFIIPACAVDAPHRRDRVWIVAHAESLRAQRHGTSRKQKSHAHDGEKVFMRGSQRPAPTQWATEPSVGRVAHGIRNRAHRIKALGNAVVPQVVTQIGRAIIQAEC